MTEALFFLCGIMIGIFVGLLAIGKMVSEKRRDRDQ